MSAAQGSPQWLMERVAKITASRFCDVMAKLKDGRSAKAREDYMLEVVVERLTGQPTDHYISKPMLDGIEREPIARMKYEARTGTMVEEVGFIQHPTLPLVGGSPDGTCGSDGIIEIKAPTASTHIRTLLDGISADHIPQVQGNLLVTGRAWCDFISYYPDLPAPLDLYIQRIERDDEYISFLQKEIALFLSDVDALLNRLRPEESAAQAVEAVTPDAAHPPVVEAPAAADTEPEFITPDQAVTLETLCQDAKIPLERFRKRAGVTRLAEIRASRYAKAVAWITSQGDQA